MASSHHVKSDYRGTWMHAGERRRVCMQTLHIAKLIRLLIDGPHTYAELAEETGLHWRTVRNWVADFRKQKLVRLCGAAPDSRGYLRVPLFEWAPDKPDWKPKRKTSGERSAEYRANKRKKTLPSRIVGPAVRIIVNNETAPA